MKKTVSYTRAEPYATAFVPQALDRAGRFDPAIRIIRHRWHKLMAAKGVMSVYEERGMNGSWRYGAYSSFYRTLSHDWSAYPAQFLFHNLIGLEILEPGCTKIRLDPKQIGEDYQVICPLPQGEAVVRMENGRARISLPPGTVRAVFSEI